MSGSLAFNGVSAESFGLRIGCVDVYNGPAQSMNPYAVPGRIGDVLPRKDLTQIPNQIITYDAALYMKNASAADVSRRMQEIRQWLMAPSGYKTLVDSYEPDVYRKAYLTNDIGPVRKGSGQNFTMKLSFSADPRRFLRNVGSIELEEGETLSVTTPATINGYAVNQKAKPMLKLNWDGTGKITFRDHDTQAVIGKITLALNEDMEEVWFDTETLNATFDEDGTQNANSLISDVSGEIRLGPGAVDIVLSHEGTYAYAEIYPRYWVR